MGVAGVVRVGARRVGVQRDVEDVPALPEQLLRPVAVVVVHVQDRHAREGGLSPEPLGHDRGVVEEAVAAQHPPRRVMAGRAAQPVGQRLTVDHAPRGGQRHVHRDVGRGGGAGHDRRGGVEAVGTEPPVRRRGLVAQLHRPRIGLELERVGDQRPRAVDVARIQRRAPGVVDHVDQRRVVDGEDRPVTERIGLHEREAVVSGERPLDLDGALRHLEARDRHAAHQLHQPGVGKMGVAAHDRRRLHRLAQGAAV